jgi:hypothetical protein
MNSAKLQVLLGLALTLITLLAVSSSNSLPLTRFGQVLGDQDKQIKNKSDEFIESMLWSFCLKLKKCKRTFMKQMEREALVATEFSTMRSTKTSKKVTLQFNKHLNNKQSFLDANWG